MFAAKRVSQRVQAVSNSADRNPPRLAVIRAVVGDDQSHCSVKIQNRTKADAMLASVARGLGLIPFILLLQFIFKKYSGRWL
jgi:hypothetical protein